MILVFGGTTEGKWVAKTLDAHEILYYYSTKTQVAFSGKGIPIHGAMTLAVLTEFCEQQHITKIINASHPFATVLHATVAAVPQHLPLFRVQREFSPRVSHPLVHYVSDFEAALELMNVQGYTSMLGLSGVQTIVKLTPFWEKHRAWFRILDRDVSRGIAQEANFPMTHLVYGYPKSKAAEMELYIKIQPQVIVTKESGTTGKLDEKIAAAIALDIPIIVIKRPKLSNRYLCIQSEEELVSGVQKTL